MYDVGFYSTMIALQYAKVDPNEIEQRVAQFKDAKEFANFVKRYLSALYQASADAAKILELEDKNRELKERMKKLEAENVYLEYLLNRANRKIKMLDEVVQLMFIGACNWCKQKFAWALSLYATMHKKEIEELTK